MNYTSVKLIMDKITRHPLMQDISLETAIDYAIDFIRIVGIPKSFFEKTADIEIQDYRGMLPCDFYNMIQVRIMNHKHESHHAFRASTDSFHMSGHKGECRKEDLRGGLTYKIQGSCIITSIREGTIEIAYMAMPLDEEGYPLIPDNSSYSRALELFIKVQWFTILFDLGKISQPVLTNAQQQYAWAVGQAQTDLIMPTIDEMEAISNMWNKLLPDVTEDHKHGYILEGSKERIITH